MAKSFEKLEARKLRRGGKSIKNIARILKVSKSSASVWCQDIHLSPEQVEYLKENQIKSGYRGRMMGAAMNRKKREDSILQYQQLGRTLMRNINLRDINMLGLGLYMGEGRKSGRRFTFTNSDPATIQLIMVWLRDVLKVKEEDINCRIYINKIHTHRIPAVQKQWVRITGISANRFRRTVLINAPVKKIYENQDSYLGILAVDVAKSSQLYYKILGLIDGLVYNLKVRMSA